jgi:hypothetical protein
MRQSKLQHGRTCLECAATLSIGLVTPVALQMGSVCVGPAAEVNQKPDRRKLDQCSCPKAWIAM